MTIRRTPSGFALNMRFDDPNRAPQSPQHSVSMQSSGGGSLELQPAISDLVLAPKEIKLKIMKNLSVKEQAALQSVCKAFRAVDPGMTKRLILTEIKQVNDRFRLGVNLEEIPFDPYAEPQESKISPSLAVNPESGTESAELSSNKRFKVNGEAGAARFHPPYGKTAAIIRKLCDPFVTARSVRVSPAALALLREYSEIDRTGQDNSAEELGLSVSKIAENPLTAKLFADLSNFFELSISRLQHIKPLLQGDDRVREFILKHAGVWKDQSFFGERNSLEMLRLSEKSKNFLIANFLKLAPKTQLFKRKILEVFQKQIAQNPSRSRIFRAADQSLASLARPNPSMQNLPQADRDKAADFITANADRLLDLDEVNAGVILQMSAANSPAAGNVDYVIGNFDHLLHNSVQRNEIISSCFASAYDYENDKALCNFLELPQNAPIFDMADHLLQTTLKIVAGKGERGAKIIEENITKWITLSDHEMKTEAINHVTGAKAAYSSASINWLFEDTVFF